jgi:hypothetical protein
MDVQILIAVGIVVIVAIALIRWRAGTRYGTITPSQDITKAYEDFSVDSELNYYISGSDTYPNAIIGIGKTWMLESDLWKKKDLSSREMKELVQNMQSRALELNIMLHGFVILDRKGRKIGNWFSIMGLAMVVEVTGEKSVIIHPPPVDTCRQC